MEVQSDVAFSGDRDTVMEKLLMYNFGTAMALIEWFSESFNLRICLTFSVSPEMDQ